MVAASADTRRYRPRKGSLGSYALHLMRTSVPDDTIRSYRKISHPMPKSWMKSAITIRIVLLPIIRPPFS